ncbi:MAG: 4Fe-4S dicluster domain-containing protein [bacterium]|nr:4Fe-4S dicluster domain-containing protein [bacterium]
METREIFWNVPLHWLTYVVAFAVIIFTAILFIKRISAWWLGKPEARLDNIPKRIANFIFGGLLQTRTYNKAFPGIFHALIFWGFVVLMMGTAILTLYEHIGFPQVTGTFYLVFSLFLDIFGAVTLLGLVLAGIRRYILKPPELDNKGNDRPILLLLGGIVITGFLVEGFRIAYSNEVFEIYSIVGWLISRPFLGLGDTLLRSLHLAFWLLHLALSLLFFVLLPTTKLFHIFAIPIAAFFADLRHPGQMRDTDDLEEAEEFGITTLRDLTWRDILDFDACVRCGRCEAVCPTHLSEKPLSPKTIVQDLKDYFNDNKGIIRAKDEEAGVISEETEISGDAIWACTTCLHCYQVCPAYSEQMHKVLELRRSQVLMQEAFPAEVATAFRNFETNSNPWGIGWAERAEWAKELDVPIAGDGAEFEYLFYVGCAGSFDKRNRGVSEAFVEILKAANVSFAILGIEEKCCGESLRRLGHEFLFHDMAMENIESFKQYGTSKVITTCPHCYNTFKNEYPALGLGGDFEVLHETQFIWQLIAEGKIKPGTTGINAATFHDSCYLGRYNGVFAEPRETLSACGIKISEMKRKKEDSFCCGGGGGRMWLEENIGVHINRLRAEEAIATGADEVIAACPYCLTMLEDGVNELDMEDNIKVKDIAEVVAGRIK